MDKRNVAKKVRNNIATAHQLILLQNLVAVIFLLFIESWNLNEVRINKINCKFMLNISTHINLINQ